jgi:hypothetical protein
VHVPVDPVGAAKFTSGCEAAKAVLAGKEPKVADAGFARDLGAAVTAAGYPTASDAQIFRAPPGSALAQVGEPIGQRDAPGAASHVAERDRHEVAEHGRDADRPARCEVAGGKDVEVRDGVLEAERDEGGDREEDREDPPGDVGRREGQPDREADERVAEQPAEESLDRAERELGVGDGGGRPADIPAIEPDRWASATAPKAPAAFPASTTAQLRSRARVPTRRAAQAMVISALPVKSSAPPTSTSTRPRAKAAPPSSRVGPKPSVLPVTTSV